MKLPIFNGLYPQGADLPSLKVLHSAKQQKSVCPRVLMNLVIGLDIDREYIC